ncbi:MAG: iron-sulfur cluster insertion protein ErpA [Fimbriimonadaceae bacterium]|nr:iron-sulfur cluster insertion protein ErpA [Fimbriimonadaceae bacterium]QYK55929.1 MAG: iron-sulfur cluster insertion protein ErpA [Fimbriimonadaceae bacterium]
MSIILTPRAACELRELMVSQGKQAAMLRVWVQGGGCSGLSYGMALDDAPADDDDQVFTSEEIQVVVDGMSLQYMAGATVDYVDDIMGGGFKIDNPNAVSSCGCGSSFKTAESEGGAGCGGCCGSN